MLGRAAVAALDAANKRDAAADVFSVLNGLCKEVPDRVVEVFDNLELVRACGGGGGVVFSRALGAGARRA